jgi:transcriptional regulator with XRE-family HTH domain
MLTKEEIGQRILNARSAMTQNEFSAKLAAEGINLSRETISKIENGGRMVSAIELKAICKVLNIDSSVILGEEEEGESLVTLFRKRGILTSQLEEEISYIQEMIVDFIAQKHLTEK